MLTHREQARRFPVLGAVLAVLTCAACGPLTADDRPSPNGPPPAGQITLDPAHPQGLVRHGGGHVFLCGPGDPEDFLYLGRRNPDGTREGDQVRRIEKLAEHGGNCLYMQIVRSHGGDAKDDGTQNPFVDSDPARGLDEDILNQWEQWFSLMDRHDILIYLFFYDDSARLWDTGDSVGPEERRFVEGVVRKFMHHKNLIWIVAEESEERYSTRRVQAIAEVIRAADAHGHLIGNHHHSGTTFKAWEPGGALQHFSMQLTETGDAAHAGALEAIRVAAGRYQVIYSESTETPNNVEGMRRHAWSIAMAGLMPMLYQMDVASTPAESLNQCRALQQFFEASESWTLTSHDELRHAGTKYVLADPGRSYIAYADDLTGGLGLRDLPAGTYALTWLDCRTGRTVQIEQAVPRRGDHAFDRPDGIGAECAAWVRRQTTEGGAPAKTPAPAAAPAKAGAAVNPAPMTNENRAPVALDKKVAAVSGRERYIQLAFEDADGPGPYTYTIVRAPQHGTLSGDDNDRGYTPQAGFTGTDQFAWKVNDGQTDSKAATITIVVAVDGQTARDDTAYFPPPDAQGGWRALQDAAEIRRVAGMDRRKLDEAFAFIQGSTKHGGLLVLRKGRLVYEDYFGLGHREATPNLASCGKSFTSIAVGMLMAERPELFPEGLDQKVFTPTYFPAEAFPLSEPRKADVKLGQLLAFTAGIRGNNPSYVMGRPATLDPVGPDGWQAGVDAIALGKEDGQSGQTPFTTATLWCDPGAGYSYATSSIHLASIMLRHVTGMELQAYLDQRLAQPLGWGRWGYGYQTYPELKHTHGGGGIALRATDMLRFGYLLLHEGRWNGEQVVPADYVRHCSRTSPYNPHFPYSLQFNVNTEGQASELPRDAFWKSGSGGHALYVVPSLDLVVWKLGGRDEQYSPTNTGLPPSPAPPEQVAARSGWKETVDKETALRKTLELVIDSIVE